MKRIALLSLMAMLSIRIHGQQIGEIDLGRHQFDTAEVRDVNIMPAGCGVTPAVHGDGVIVAPDPNTRSKLKVELTLSKNTFKRGETVEGSILMQNVGTDAIVIPWKLDPRVSIRPKDISQYAYEMGWFELKLKGARKVEIPLEAESQSHFLYSSASSPGSSLSINPGEWVIFSDERRTSSVLLPIKTGNADIEVEWRQARFEWQADGCAVKTGYFSYVYQQDARPIKVNVAE
jgi:hypothetical protein